MLRHPEAAARRFRRLPVWLRPPARSAAPRPRHRRTETEARAGTSSPLRAYRGGGSTPRPRTSQQPTRTPTPAMRGTSDVVRGLNQRPSRKRRARSLPARRGSARSPRRRDPGSGYDREPARAPIPAPGKAAATAASGASAALSIRPSMTSERLIARKPADSLGSGARRRSASHRQSGREGRRRSAPRRRCRRRAQAERAAHGS